MKFFSHRFWLKWRIYFLVIFFHFAILVFFKKTPSKEKPKIALKKREVQVLFSEIKPHQTPATKKKTSYPSSSIRKKSPKKAPVKKKKKRSITPKKNGKSVKKIQRMNRLLEEIETPHKYQASAKIQLPKKLAPITIGKISSSNDISSDTEKLLAKALQESIILPQKGNIKIRLVLEVGGKLISMQILQSSSAENKEYIERIIPELFFPKLSDTLPVNKQETFEINLVAQ